MFDSRVSAPTQKPGSHLSLEKRWFLKLLPAGLPWVERCHPVLLSKSLHGLFAPSVDRQLNQQHCDKWKRGESRDGRASAALRLCLPARSLCCGERAYSRPARLCTVLWIPQRSGTGLLACWEPLRTASVGGWRFTATPPTAGGSERCQGHAPHGGRCCGCQGHAPTVGGAAGCP